MNELIKRAAEMLNISATVIRKHIPHVIVEYDDTHCDGVCIADDCEAIAEMICEKEGGALKAERDRIEELEAKLAKAVEDRDAMVEAAYRMALDDAAASYEVNYLLAKLLGVEIPAYHLDLRAVTPPADLVERVGK